MKIIEFDGDPMLQLEKVENMDKSIFHLNQESVDEIASYSEELKENIPQFFVDKDSSIIYLAKGGIDEEGNEFPDTYIGIKCNDKSKCPYTITAIYASDFQYACPKTGEEIFLKKKSNEIFK
ncbi:MAG: hypothetical protein IK137_02995 [Bacilli bacterium]|nr:hypothetical protein [Bacilli bacterium]